MPRCLTCMTNTPKEAEQKGLLAVPDVVATQPALRAFERRPPAVLGRSPHGRLRLRLPECLNIHGAQRRMAVVTLPPHWSGPHQAGGLGSTWSPMAMRSGTADAWQPRHQRPLPARRPTSGGQRLAGCNCPAAEAGGQRGLGLSVSAAALGRSPRSGPPWSGARACSATLRGGNKSRLRRRPAAQLAPSARLPWLPLIVGGRSARMTAKAVPPAAQRFLTTGCAAVAIPRKNGHA